MAAQPPRRKPAQKQQAGRHNDLAIIALIGAVAIVLAFVYQSFHTDGFSLSTKKNKDGETAAVTEIYGCAVCCVIVGRVPGSEYVAPLSKVQAGRYSLQ